MHSYPLVPDNQSVGLIMPKLVVQINQSPGCKQTSLYLLAHGDDDDGGICMEPKLLPDGRWKMATV